jgi:transcription-repair coupling factor (superfamily II helicase)
MPDLSKLLTLIEPLPAFQRVTGGLERSQENMVVLLDAARPFLVASLYRYLRRPVLLITAQPESARKLHEQLSSWAPAGSPVMLFPEPDVLPYERLASDATTEMDRVRVLSMLAGPGRNGSVNPLIVASAAALPWGFRLCLPCYRAGYD